MKSYYKRSFLWKIITFLFNQKVLVEKGIFASANDIGKLAFRLFPPRVVSNS